jgi:hypothetical protein
MRINEDGGTLFTNAVYAESQVKTIFATETIVIFSVQMLLTLAAISHGRLCALSENSY